MREEAFFCFIHEGTSHLPRMGGPPPTKGGYTLVTSSTDTPNNAQAYKHFIDTILLTKCTHRCCSDTQSRFGSSWRNWLQFNTNYIEPLPIGMDCNVSTGEQHTVSGSIHALSHISLLWLILINFFIYVNSLSILITIESFVSRMIFLDVYDIFCVF